MRATLPGVALFACRCRLKLYEIKERYKRTVQSEWQVIVVLGLPSCDGRVLVMSSLTSTSGRHAVIGASCR